MRVLSRQTIYDARQRPPDERIAFFTSLCRLRSGVLLAGFQLGPSKHSPRATVRLCRSGDERALLTQGRENIDYAQFWEDMGKWSFGHPAIRRLDERRALVAWYAGTPTEMSIHGAQVELDL